MTSITARPGAPGAASISNKPSFSLDPKQSEKVPGLQLLSNIAPGQRPARNVVVAASLVPEAAAAVAWTAKQLCRPGDCIHLVHVVRCLTTPSEVYHPGPGNAIPVDEQPHHERQDVMHAQQLIKKRLLPLIEEDSRLFYSVHVYVDTWNAPPEAVGTTVLRSAAELQAFAVVLASNDQMGWDPLRLGSVAKWMLGHKQDMPIALVRKAQIPAAKDAAQGANVLIAVDNTPASEEACQWAADNILQPGDTAHLIHVVAPSLADVMVLTDVPAPYMGESLKPVMQQHVAEAKGFIERSFAPRLQGFDYKTEVVLAHTGAKAVGALLCEHALKVDAAALVMASHQKGAMQRFFLGSTTDYCAKHSLVPLVIAR